MLTQRFQLALGAAALSVSAALTPANDAEAHTIRDRHGHRIPHVHTPPPVYGPPVYVDPRAIEFERQRQIRLQQEYDMRARGCVEERARREWLYDPPPMSRWCRRNGF